MKRMLLLIPLIAGVLGVSGQDSATDAWRSEGYQAKVGGDYPLALGYYRKILEQDSTDYDARLAVARLLVQTEEYNGAIAMFGKIYAEDQTDVEAMNGLGECYGALGRDSLAVTYFEQASKYLPDEISQHLLLAKAYGNAGRMKDAIGVYEKINRIDDTYSEAWAGMGKMNYWLDRPVSAARCYKKALDLDPRNEEIRKEYADVKQESGWGVSLRVSPVQEKEESYTINALVSRLQIGKRISDHFRVEANFLLDHSNRDFTDERTDTTRWYNAAWIRAEYLTGHHTIGVFGGYSFSDKKASGYGAFWKMNYTTGKFTWKNTLRAGYDYYYYWNRVGSAAVEDEASVKYAFVELGGSYSYGLTDAVYCYDNSSADTGKVRGNPFQSYGINLSFRIIKRPDIRVALSHSYLDYSWKSPLYYSPDRRRLTGAGASLYYNVRRFYVFGSFSYKIGTEYNFGEKLNVNNWTTSLELGYRIGGYSISMGAGNFNNPYYKNLTGFAAIKAVF